MFKSIQHRLPLPQRASLVILAIVATVCPARAAPAEGADWTGGPGNWSNRLRWYCTAPADLNGHCVPNSSNRDVTIGNAGNVLLDMNATTLGLLIGFNGAGKLDVAGTTLTNTLENGVGSDASGTLTIRGGGTVNDNIADVGVLGNGTATVSGAGSRWSVTTGLSVGADKGSGMLTVESGAHVVVGGVAGLGTLSSGTATVTGAGSLLSANSLLIGGAGKGTLTIDEGGAATVAGPTALAGVALGPQTEGSLILGRNATFASTGILQAGAGGPSQITLQKDARNISADSLVLGPLSTVHFDIEPAQNPINTPYISIKNDAHLAGGFELNQIGSSQNAGIFFPLLTANTTNIPLVGTAPLPYLRLKETSPQEFNAIDMAGNQIANIAIPQNTLQTASHGPSVSGLIPTAIQNSANGNIELGVVPVDGINLKVVPMVKNAAPAGAMMAVASATTNGVPVSMGVAAAALGFDHFNWIQFIVSDDQLKGCIDAQTGCAGNRRAVTGSFPGLPTSDPPQGGWAYQKSNLGPGQPSQDYWPTYYDEYFNKGAGGVYVQDPTSPEYLYGYGNNQRQVSPDAANTFDFGDKPAPEPNDGAIHFETALVGMKGTGCNTLDLSGDCSWDIIPNTQFSWWDVGGTVVFPKGIVQGPLVSSTESDSLGGSAKYPSYVDNPDPLSPAELANAEISLDQFLADTGLTPSELAALGGGISDFSADPLLSVPEPGSLTLTATGLLLLLVIRLRDCGRGGPLRQSALGPSLRRPRGLLAA
jgi:T5SS/PEP-CTERM-associated repeat protein